MSDKLLTHIKPTKPELNKGKAFQKSVLEKLPISGNTSLLRKMSQNRKEGVGGKPASKVSTVSRLNQLQRRALAICAEQNIEAAKDFFKNALESLSTDANRTAVNEMVAASMGGGDDAKTARAALGKMIAVNVGHLIRSTSMWVQWYESITLGETDKPFIRNYVPQQVGVRLGTADGYLRTHDVQPDDEDDSAVPLFFIISDMVHAKLFDEYEGNVGNANLAVVDIAMDLAEKVDSLLQLPFLVGTANSVYTGTFVNDGTTASHYLATSRINTANFPTGNIIAPSTNGAATKPRLDCIRAIDEYFGRFGNGFDVDGDMVAGRVHVASGIAHEFGLEFDATSHQNVYTDGLFKNRGRIDYNGRTYEIIPDNTLDPTDKYLYVNSNLPAGLFFDKPAGSKVFRMEDEIQNEVQTFERKLMGYAFPLTFAPRVLAVKFKN
jgi:hypothetical protein